ncbi:MAG: hypothetical protein FGM26_12100 [Beijerinckiaceae bacterium]|nr:hypothetical protein [Beijerinckiaceae bacterium]
MTSSSSLMIRTLVAAAGLMIAPLALAQNAGGPPPNGKPPAAQSLTPDNESPGNGPPAPVLAVTGVEVMRSALPGGMDIVRARGVVSSGAWANPILMPITRGPSADGVIDFVFVANAPLAGVEPGPFMPVEAILPLANGFPYKGVRVRGASNVVQLKTLPGATDIPAPKADCAQCIGKVFAFKGTANPPADAIREENLPWKLRIIRLNEGIASFDVDPNRLSLLLGEDNRIVAALWE